MAKKQAPTQSRATTPLTYSEAGVDIEANDTMVDLIRAEVERTHSPRVVYHHNAFAGLFRLDYDQKLFKRNYREPILVACTDGVGTKIKIASAMKQFHTVGIDLVAMSVNDMLVHGAEPLFFLDYLAVNQLKPPQILDFVKGISEGCRQADCALLGGETAEMPGLYRRNDFDMAGFAVGVVEKKRLITGDNVEPGDVVIGLASSGLHSNGYTLARHICTERDKLPLKNVFAPMDEPLGQALLAPTRIYIRPVLKILKRYKVKKVVKAMAHITGGGLVGNVPRILPPHCDVVLKRSAWQVPPIFRFLQEQGPVEDAEMFRVFNMGIGYVMIVSPSFADSILNQLEQRGETAWVIGHVRRGKRQVILK